MRRVSGAFVLGLLLLSTARVEAATMPFQGVLTIPAIPLPLTSFAMSGSGVATLNSSGGGAHLNTLALPASPFATAGFFFQAEDGIRDADVTGVETCALPI